MASLPLHSEFQDNMINWPHQEWSDQDKKIPEIFPL